MKEVKNIPELRFPEFNDNWEIRNIGTLGKFFGGGTPESSKKEFWEGNIPWISSSDIIENNIQDINITRYINDNAISNSATKKIPKGSVLMVSRVGIGKFAVAPTDLCTSQDFTSLVTDENSYFLGYYFIIKANRFVRLSQGTSIKGFTGKDIKSAKFHIPKLPEQTKIANFLTTVDKRISLLSQQKEKLEQYKKGLMQLIFNQQIRFKDDNGKKFADWKEKRLGDVYEIVGGGTPDTTNENYWNGDIQWFTPTEIKTKYVVTSRRKINQEGLRRSSAKLLPKGTLLFTSRATIGDAGISVSECCTNQGFQSFIPNRNNDIEFLYYWIMMNKKEFVRRSSGSTFLEISKKEIQKIRILLPSLQEQQKIASFLSAIDKKIELVSQQIEHTKTWKKGLLQKMFV